MAKVTTLVNQLNGELSFKLFSFDDDSYFDHIQRHNYYSIILVLNGNIELQIDLTKFKIDTPTAICISPYQPYSIKSSDGTSGIVLHFHPDFFCTYKHQNEIETEGLLFNNIYNPPFFKLENEQALLAIFHQMEAELQQPSLAQHELLVSFLKVFLILLIRIKVNTTDKTKNSIDFKSKPQILQALTNNIESCYKQKHSAADYAEKLNISTAALNKLVKAYFSKTLSELITDRIMLEAKRELYLTSKSVKEIAYLLGYQDEFYFSRFFKKQAGVSPIFYRKTVGFAKQE